MSEQSEQYKEYLRMKELYEKAVIHFNNIHRGLKKYKKETLLPIERELRKCEKELFKSKQ